MVCTLGSGFDSVLLDALLMKRECSTAGLVETGVQSQRSLRLCKEEREFCRSQVSWDSGLAPPSDCLGTRCWPNIRSSRFRSSGYVYHSLLWISGEPLVLSYHSPASLSPKMLKVTGQMWYVICDLRKPLFWKRCVPPNDRKQWCTRDHSTSP